MNSPTQVDCSPDAGSLPLAHRAFRAVHIFRFTVALLVVGLVWRTVRYALNFPLWGDEAAVALQLLPRGFSGLVCPLGYLQFAPLGFLWSELVAAKLFGISELALRLIPYLCSVLSLWLFYRFTRRILDPRGALLAVAIFAAATAAFLAS